MRPDKCWQRVDRFKRDVDSLLAYCEQLEQENNLLRNTQRRLRQNGPWTYCDDKMPEKSDFYLVTLALGSVNRIVRAIYWLGDFKRWDMRYDYVDWTVVCWRPLPEPAEVERKSVGVIGEEEGSHERSV